MSNQVMGVGATLAALLLSSPAFAQTLPSPAPRMPAQAQAQATSSQRAAEDIGRNQRIANQYALPPEVLTSVKDDYGRPRPRLIEDAIRDLGIDGARMKAQDDANFCVSLVRINELKGQIRAADLEVKRADEAVARAVTRAEKKAAEARSARARTNFLQLLLTGVRVGLVTQIPGVGWAYGGYVLASEFSNYLSRNQHNKELETTDAMNDVFLAQSRANTLRLESLDLRLQQHDMRGELYDASMGQYCSTMKPYYDRLNVTSASATYTPSASNR